ncbi:MAG: hypothetical protein D8H92_13670 [Campylobacter sp.]|nr:MAG: hypothetical protein D8H92_13670 [Campylobacter sp.]
MPSLGTKFTSKHLNSSQGTSAYVFWAARRLVLQISACIFAFKFAISRFQQTLLFAEILRF